MPITLEEFIEMNRGFLYKLATKYSHSTYILGIEFDDLYQAGCLALIEKFPQYNVTKGTLSTFSHIVIRGAMLNYIRVNSTCTNVANDLLYLTNVLYNKNELFYMMNGRYMTLKEQKEWANQLEIASYKDRNELVKWLNIINLYHLKHNTCSIEDTIEIFSDELIAFLPDGQFPDIVDNYDSSNLTTEDVEDMIISKIYIEEFIASIDYLSERDKDIWIERVGLYDNIPKTCLFLAEKYSITQQRIDQIYKRATEKIKIKNNLI